MTDATSYPPFLLEKNGRPDRPVVVSSPHSGTFYPERLFRLTDLKVEDFQKYEDPAVSSLFSFAPAMGLPLISAVYARAWVDLNRHPLEVDIGLFSDAPPAGALSDSPRVKAGHGVIPSRLSKTEPVYPKRLLWRREKKRIEDVHFPYHAALTELINDNLARFGKSVLLDVHSTPDLPQSMLMRGTMPDIILGNLDGASCAPDVMSAAVRILTEQGLTVAVNAPYRGAYTTQRYGVPDKHSHALQIEIARRIYWDEKNRVFSDNFKDLWRKLSVFADKFLTATDSMAL